MAGRGNILVNNGESPFHLGAKTPLLGRLDVKANQFDSYSDIYNSAALPEECPDCKAGIP